MQTNPAVEQSKIIRWSESQWNQSGLRMLEPKIVNLVCADDDSVDV